MSYVNLIIRSAIESTREEGTSFPPLYIYEHVAMIYIILPDGYMIFCVTYHF